MKQTTKQILLLLLLSACSTHNQVAEKTHDSYRATAGSPEWSVTYPKEARSIQELERRHKELVEAEHRLAVQKSRVDILREAYYSLQLSVIQRRVEVFERHLARVQKNADDYRYLLEQHLPKLFNQEREALMQLMEHNEALAQKGQLVLDQILRIITQLSEDKVSMSLVPTEE